MIETRESGTAQSLVPDFFQLCAESICPKENTVNEYSAVVFAVICNLRE